MTLKFFNLPCMREAVCLALLVSLASLFVPLPAHQAVNKDRSVPFPCQSSSCGCQTSEDCWTNCCCFSDAEKIAWARANNVQPPAWFRPPPPTTRSGGEPEATTCECCCPAKTDIDKALADRTTAKLPAEADQKAANADQVSLNFVFRSKCRGDADYILSRIVLAHRQPDIAAEPDSEPLCAQSIWPFFGLKSKPPTPPPRQRSV